MKTVVVTLWFTGRKNDFNQVSNGDVIVEKIVFKHVSFTPIIFFVSST